MVVSGRRNALRPNVVMNWLAQPASADAFAGRARQDRGQSRGDALRQRLGRELQIARVHRADRRRLAKRERVVADVVRLAGDVVHGDRGRVVEQVAHRVEVLARRQPAQRQRPGGVRIGVHRAPASAAAGRRAGTGGGTGSGAGAPRRRRRRFLIRFPRRLSRRRRPGIRRPRPASGCLRSPILAVDPICTLHPHSTPHPRLTERRRAMKAVLTGMGPPDVPRALSGHRDIGIEACGIFSKPPRAPRAPARRPRDRRGAAGWR